MNFSNLLKELGGGLNSHDDVRGKATHENRGIAQSLPGGLAGGAVAGGLVALLLGNKSARKTAGKAAKYGGVALLGGLAYKAYKGWQEHSPDPVSAGEMNRAIPNASAGTIQGFEQEALEHANGAPVSHDFQLALMQAMIAAARADGQIDNDERNRIAAAINSMQIEEGVRSQLLDLFLKDIAISDFTRGLQTPEQKAEIYLASCLAIELNDQSEYTYLNELANALDLPQGLEQELRAQATNVMATAA